MLKFKRNLLLKSLLELAIKGLKQGSLNEPCFSKLICQYNGSFINAAFLKELDFTAVVKNVACMRSEMRRDKIS